MLPIKSILSRLKGAIVDDRAVSQKLMSSLTTAGDAHDAGSKLDKALNRPHHDLFMSVRCSFGS